MKAIEAFERVLFLISPISSRRFENKPGAVIESMSSGYREALQDLKSNEIAEDQRTQDHWRMYAARGRRKWDEKELREDFDKKLGIK
jgi:hypothetical protein